MVDRGLFDDQKGNLSKGIDSRIPTREGAKVLPPGYAPGEWDVICHSGKEAQDHIGNRRFDICVENHIEAYNKAKSRMEKSSVISEIVESIRESSTTGGGFVRFDMRMERWYEVGDKIARDRVGQSLRALNPPIDKKKSPEKEAPLSRLSEAPRLPIEPTPIASVATLEGWSHQPPIDQQLRLDQPARSNTALLVPRQPPPTANAFAIDDTMAQATDNGTKSDKRKSNSSSDESPSDNSLIAWFEEDSRGTI